MTPFKAGFDAWRKIGLRQQQNEHYASALIELKQRVKALEDDSNAQSVSTHFCFESIIKRLEALEDAQVASPTPPKPAPIGSLVERVAAAISDDGWPARIWHKDSRAAIREVIDWLQEKEFDCSVIRCLEQEVDQ